MQGQQDWNSLPDNLADGGPVEQESRDAMWRVLDEWQAPSPDASFDARVMARIRAETSDVPARDGWRAWFGWLPTGRSWAVAAAMATLVLAALLLRTPANLTPPPDAAVGTGMASAELSVQQVEMAIEDLRMLEELYGSTAQEDGQSNRL